MYFSYLYITSNNYLPHHRPLDTAILRILFLSFPQVSKAPWHNNSYYIYAGMSRFISNTTATEVPRIVNTILRVNPLRYQDCYMMSASSTTDARSLLSQKRKESSSASGQANATLSGKDKVAMLKKMRELQKDTSGSHKSQPPITKAASNSNDSDHKGPKVQKVEPSSAVPAGFYDANAAATTAGVGTVSTAPRVPVVSSLSNSSTAKYSEAQPVSVVQTSLPQGFFDNPIEDSKARGIDLFKVIQTKEKEASLQLKSFLEEINENNDVQEEADASEEEIREQENEAIQMSYVLRYAGLLNKAAQITEKAPGANMEFGEGDEVVKAYLPVVNEDLLAQNGSDDLVSGGTHQLTNAQSIEEIMRLKRKEAKRQRKQKESEEYVPLDATDWMARFI
jgi:hypothetical protein